MLTTRLKTLTMHDSMTTLRVNKKTNNEFKMNNTELYKRPTPKFLWLYLTLSALLCVYILCALPNGDGKLDIKEAVREQELHDARVDLEDAERRIRKLQYETN
jgi:hypothetical protein